MINNAKVIKRTELELRAIDPLLANVSDQPKADDALVDFVRKAFGNIYAKQSPRKGCQRGDGRPHFRDGAVARIGCGGMPRREVPTTPK